MDDKDKISESYQVWLDEYFSSMSDNGGVISLDDDTITIGNIDLGDSTIDIDYSDWIYPDPMAKDNITLTGGGEEMLRVAKDGFYVRGVRVEADEKEAKQVYEAFKQWLTWSIMNGER